MGITVYTSKLIRSDHYEEYVDIAALAKDFLKHKKDANQPLKFGRDELYKRPSDAVFVELRHVHTNLDGKLKWRMDDKEFKRVSNAAIVYCQGEKNKDNYLLIAYLQKNAHERANKITYMMELAEMAAKFRKNF
jgi:mRNA interferase YafO